MVEVRKRPRETTYALVRKFSSRVRMSGLLREAKKRQFYQPSLSDGTKRAKALKKLRRLKT